MTFSRVARLSTQVSIYINLSTAKGLNLAREAYVCVVSEAGMAIDACA